LGHGNIWGLDREALKVLQELCAKGEERLKSMVPMTSTKGWVDGGHPNAINQPFWGWLIPPI
jgi:hypothetical protein